MFCTCFFFLKNNKLIIVLIRQSRLKPFWHSTFGICNIIFICVYYSSASTGHIRCNHRHSNIHIQIAFIIIIISFACSGILRPKIIKIWQNIICIYVLLWNSAQCVLSEVLLISTCFQLWTAVIEKFFYNARWNFPPDTK